MGSATTIKSMTTVLEDEALRPLVIEDAAVFIDEEVKSKKGFSGTLIKGGYAVVKRLNKGRMIHEVLEGLLPEFVASIEPLHARFRDDAGAHAGGFGSYLEQHGDEATQSLLGVTDKRAERTRHNVIKSTYTKLRPRAEEHVKAGLPGLGKLIDKYTRG